MIFPQIRITLYKKIDPSSQRCAWANYNEHGIFVNITDYYGEVLHLSDHNQVYIHTEIWILKDHLNKTLSLKENRTL